MSKETEYADRVECGFKKWSIGVGKNGEVIIDFNYHPHYGTINLYDTSVEDLQNLGEMFLVAARNAKQAADNLNKKQ